MAKWIVEINEGYGWEEPRWTPSFDTEEEAWDYIYGPTPVDPNRWDVPVRAVQEDEDEFDELNDIGTADEEDD